MSNKLNKNLTVISLNFLKAFDRVDREFILWIMCCIPGTWHDSSTVNITIEEFCQNRKKKSWPLLLKTCASNS